MKREELEVGMTICKGGWLDRFIMGIGSKKYFFSTDNSNENHIETMAWIDDIDTWEPEREKPKLFYKWKIEGVKGFYISKYYYNEFGYREDGTQGTDWHNRHVEIATEFKPITKDGKYYEGE